MNLSSTTIYTFRILLFITFSAVTYLATATLEVTPASTVYDKFNHIIAFFALALLLDFSFPKSGFTRQKIILLLTYGLSLELIQHFLPHRMFSFYDIVADIVGMIGYGLSIPVIKQIFFLQNRWR